MKKTKIICTLGPASGDKDTIRELIKEGMNASRHNFSHGDYEEHEERMNLVKEIRKEMDRHIAIILDTKGPEIRTGKFKDKKVELKEGEEFTIVCGEDILGTEHKCSVTYDELHKDVKQGDRILIDDGLIGLKVLSVEGNKINCTIVNSGFVSDHKGVNVPGVSINLPALTEKDIEDLKFGIKQGIDIVAASFIRKASDVLAIREVLTQNGGNDVLIFSKIENREGVDNIDDIIKLSDGIMVARGDLGVEIPTEEVPLVQKIIIQKCNVAGKPVITATQMLDSMIRNPRPTRAEASDVANAIFDGTDAIMLSGETANGKYPIEAVKTMARIAKRAEKSLNYTAMLQKRSYNRTKTVPDAISLAVCSTAQELNASAIITATQSGNTAKNVSKYRPECGIIAITPYEKVARKLALNWGVFPLCSPKVETTDELIDISVEKATEAGLVNKGDLVVIAAGIPVNYVGSTNMIKVHIVGDVLVQGKGIGHNIATGTVKIVRNYKEAYDILEEGDILVVDKMDKEYIDLIKKASGIIVEADKVDASVFIECTATDTPIIYGAEGACKIIKTGTFITLEASRGLVYSGNSEAI